MSQPNVFDKPRGGTIPTTQGDMDEASLWRTLTTLEDDGEITWAVEYRIGDRNGELVHRSAHVVLKTAGAVAAMLTGNVGG